MTLSTTIPVLFLGMLGLFGLSCAGNTPAPATPASSDEVPSAPESASSDPAASGQSLDVGMEFKEKDDAESPRASHDAPPTGAWKPVDKDKSIDSKTSAASAAK